MNTARFGRRQRLVLYCTLGFAAFKAAQSSLYSTAMLTSDTTTILLSGIDFSVVSALFVIATEAVIVAAALLGKLPKLSMPLIIPSAALAGVACLSYGGVFASIDPVLALLIMTCVQGAGTVLVTLAWVELMTMLEPTASMKTLASSMLFASLFALVLPNEPSVAVPLAIVLLLGANAVLYRLAKNASMASVSSDTTDQAKESSAARGLARTKRYVRGFVSIGEGLLSLLVLGCTVGIINGFMVVQHVDFEGSSVASTVGVTAASIAFFIMAYGFPKTFSASRAYRALFPLLTGVLIIWPFANFQYSYFVGAAFVAGHSLISTSVMYLIIREAHESKLNPYAFMGASVLLIRLASVSGIIGGVVIAGLNLNPSFKTMLVFCVALYLLSLALLFMLRARKRRERLLDHDDANGAREEDSFATQASLMSNRYGLTERESEILLLLARGRSSTYIGNALYLSPNTVRGHIKNIYAKLDVHSKQELIDLFSA